MVPASLAPTSDFAGTYVASTLIGSGHAEQIYDPASERRTLVRSGAPASHDNIPFENPPAAAVIALPFTLLGAGAAWRAWSLLQLALLALSLLLVARAAPWPAAVPGLPSCGDRGGRSGGFRDGPALRRGPVGRCLGPRPRLRVRALAKRSTRRSRLRARIHGGHRQTPAGDRYRGLHDRPARLARRRRSPGRRSDDSHHRSPRRRASRVWLLRQRDRHAEQLADGADAGDQRAVRLVAGSRPGGIFSWRSAAVSQRRPSRDGSAPSPIAAPISSSRRSALPWRCRCSRRRICSDMT